MPLLGHTLLPRYQPSTNPFFFAPRILDWLNAKLYRFVKRYVNDPILIGVICIIGVSAVGGLSFYFQDKLKFELFAPASDTDQIIVKGNFEQGTSIQEAQEIATDIEERIANSDQTVHIQDVGYITANQSQLVLFIDLVPMEQRQPTSTTILANLETRLTNIENIDLTLGKGGAGPPPQQYQMTFNVFAEDQETLETVTSDLQTFLEEDISLSQGNVTKTNITNLESISARDGERYASVQVGVSDPNNTELITEVQTQVQQNFNTSEYRSEQDLAQNAIRSDLGQQGDNLQSFKSALFAMGVALIAMYMLLVLQFNSFLQPLLILSAIPLSLPGVFMGLFFTDNAFSFFATVGIIGLTGVVVNNTIILIDAANQYRHQGFKLPEAISEATKLRFRPLVTTTLTTLVGMLPLALSDPFWEGLAFALVFGLISSTFFVLLLFPAFYMIIEHIRRRR
ncbi:MAG: efflux RND transporter permease subunit, partial [Candidatus Paceibacteria bacterium]